MAARLSRIIPGSLTLLAAMVLSACTSQQAPTLKKGEKPVDVASVVRQKMPASVKDREAWAQAIATAFDSQKLAPTEENVCSVLAVAQQESNYQSDPVVPGLNKIAWQEIDRRAEKMHIPPFLVHTALKITSPNGKSYSDRLDNVKTEKQLSAIFDDFIGMVPMGQKLFGSLNPVHTGGPMQVSIAFAEKHTDGYPWKIDGTVRQEVFSLRGGLWFGTYHLLNYPASYSVPLYRFADFNAGWYASRNAAFQKAVVKASGVKLALDGDLIRYDSEEPGSTELAVRRLAGQLGMSDSEIHRQLKKGDSLESEASIVIIGNVDHGARVTAKGNVIVLGELKGTVTAGVSGNPQAVVMALDMAPLQIRIGDMSSRFNERNKRLGRGPMIALAEDGAIVMRSLKKSFLNNMLNFA